MMGADWAKREEKEVRNINNPRRPFLLSEMACFTARAVKAINVREGF